MELPSPRTVSIRNESARLYNVESIRHAVLSTCAAVTVPDGEISVLLTSNEAVRDLNGRFRGIPEETDVLTFLADDASGTICGDIAIATEYAELQAALRLVDPCEEIAFLAIHGTLHLAGFDDEDESERAQMVRQMNEIAVQAGLQPDFEWHSRLHEVQA